MLNRGLGPWWRGERTARHSGREKPDEPRPGLVASGTAEMETFRELPAPQSIGRDTRCTAVEGHRPNTETLPFQVGLTLRLSRLPKAIRLEWRVGLRAMPG